MDEETGKGHLVKCGQSGQKDRNAAIVKESGQKKVLQKVIILRLGSVTKYLLTKRVMARAYRTRINKNLKKCAASAASPAIQYVLVFHI